MLSSQTILGGLKKMTNNDSNDCKNSQLVEIVVNIGIVNSDCENNEENNVKSKENSIIDTDKENKGIDVVNTTCSDENGNFEVHVASLFSWSCFFQLQ